MKLKKKRKHLSRQLLGQSAVEFLTTYGWALILTFAALAIIYYYGVFDASRYLPRQCAIQPTLQCDSYEVESNTSLASPLRFRLLTHNGLGYRINTTGFTVYTENVGMAGKANHTGSCVTLTNSTTIPMGSYMVCTANITGSDRVPRIGESVSVNFRIDYVNLETDVAHGVQGTATTQVEPRLS